jgi:hypothetical protein
MKRTDERHKLRIRRETLRRLDGVAASVLAKVAGGRRPGDGDVAATDQCDTMVGVDYGKGSENTTRYGGANALGYC